MGNLSLTGYRGEELIKIGAFLRGLLGNETQTKVFGSEGSAIELTVVAVGWCLGGVVGVGTLLFAFGIGPSVAASLYGLQWAFGNETNKEKTL